MLIRSRPAQSLLEAIIAIGVIMVATISATTLIVTTISSGRVSADKIQAANFAREGAEVVRAIRDSNWLKRAQNIDDNHTPQIAADTTVQWDDSGSITDGYQRLEGTSYVAQYVKSTNTWSLVLNGDPVIYFRNVSTPFFTQICTEPSVCTATKYSRSIAISKITSDTNAGDYLQVVTTVTWNNHGAKSLVVTERLYDWR